jgi:REP element-mobilizing transposase RayT
MDSALFNGSEFGRTSPSYLPRLAADAYCGNAVVHWTLTIARRETGWLNTEMHLRFRELMLHTMLRNGLVCPTYCLMPDHIHLIWIGMRKDSEQKKAMAFLRTLLKPVIAPHEFQHQAHDHVLKEEERRRNAFAKVCWYVAQNPVRAGLVEEAEHWEFSDCLVPGYPKMNIFADDHWDRFWGNYERLRSSASFSDYEQAEQEKE